MFLLFIIAIYGSQEFQFVVMALRFFSLSWLLFISLIYPFAFCHFETVGLKQFQYILV